MHDQGVVRGSAFQGKDSRNGIEIAGIGGQPINGFGRNR